MEGALVAGREGTVTMPAGSHRPVLLDEALDWLRPRPDGIYVDATVGLAGHTEALLEATGPGGRVLGIDRDRQALQRAAERVASFGDRFVPIHGDYRELSELLGARDVFLVDGVLADLGVSSWQLDDPERGFSFRQDGPLDMRMDRDAGSTAAELVARLPEPELRRILREFGEERHAAAIARAIVRERSTAPIETTGQLRGIVTRALGPAARRYRIDPATRTFQALRIAVNRELERLDRFVEQAVSLLRRGGRLVVIAFHSLEDRAIKHTLRALAHRCVCPPNLPVCGCGREDLVRLPVGRPVRPSPDEVARNPRARSARLRVAERL